MTIRVAKASETHTLEALIHEAVWELQASSYSEAQRKGALGTVFGVDSQLIKDSTYYVIEIEGRVVACGGWSYRSTLFGADAGKTSEDTELNPERDAARIRAFFVSPAFARQGLGTRILQTCEEKARRKGFHKFELVATLAGEPLYAKHGFVASERFEVALPNGASLPVVRMVKP